LLLACLEKQTIGFSLCPQIKPAGIRRGLSLIFRWQILDRGHPVRYRFMTACSNGFGLGSLVPPQLVWCSTSNGSTNTTRLPCMRRTGW
jgi:hypothetical protein